MSQPLRAPLEIGFDYTRSLGPTLSRFMTGLAGRQILGSRGADGRVHAPPFEYDPVTLAPPGDLVPVGPEGTVTTWAWVPRPVEGQPLAHPFAWALIRLDGADTAILHAVDAGTAAAMRTGMRVRVRWAESLAGHIRDIACFEPCGADRRDGPPRRDAADPGPARPPEPPEPVTMITTPVRLHYRAHGLPRGEPASCARWPAGAWSGSAARPAARSTSRRGAPAPPTACRPPTRSSCPTTAS